MQGHPATLLRAANGGRRVSLFLGVVSHTRYPFCILNSIEWV
jgi:hypothetical protein